MSSLFPLFVVIQAFVLSVWSFVMLAAYLVTRAEDIADTGVDLTADNIGDTRLSRS